MTAAGSRAALATLVALDGMGPARLRAVLIDRTPSQALEAVRSGRSPLAPPPDTLSPRISRNLRAKWQVQARDIDPDANLDTYAEAGFDVVMYGESGYPERLLADPDPPLLVSIDGALSRLAAPAVAIVGTRRCTRAGQDTARQMGHDLAIAGVTVVSGLASGIDAAAHRGACDAHAAAPLAIVGTGLDVRYPRENASLWAEVAAKGAVLSEAELGAQPDRWRFPARNRIIAAMSDLVVVVESPERGGSMHTVDEADARSIEVLAVPGPVQSDHSHGTNGLLHEGRGTARSASDVLLALGTAVPVPPRPSARRPDRTQAETSVLDAFEWQAATADQLVLRSRLDLFDVCSILDQLVASGEVVTQSGWYERTTDS